MAKITTSKAKSARPANTVSPAAQALGIVVLLVSAVMSLLLVAEHLGGISLPGCREGGPCEEAGKSFWGSIRLGDFQWPVAYLGLAYFAAILAVWLAARGALPRVFRYLVRLGALCSLGFCVAIIIERLFCSYCLAAHAGNFAFWITVEFTRRRGPRLRMTPAVFGIVFVMVTAVVGVWNGWVQAALERERVESVRQIIARSQEPASREPAPEAAPEGETSGGATEPAEPATQPASRPFTGRYRQGPEQAAIRIMMFTDFQCRDCRWIKKDVDELLAQYESISVSIKYFPFCPDCNPHVRNNLHPNACWAARAAEAAGILWGNEGFWKMHDWLFDKGGVFLSTQELQDGIRGLGYDPQPFLGTMQGDETARRVRADVEEAVSLGLFFTPMIFINGVEVKGWAIPGALKQTVKEVAASDPPPRTAAHDHPPPAMVKYIEDWRHEHPLRLPDDEPSWTLGPEDRYLQVVLWGDYQEPNTAEADAIIRAFVANRDAARYTFRHYPISSDCNPNVKSRRHEHACRMSYAAEAAGRLGGNEAYWKMHVWLMENQTGFSDVALKQAAAAMGLDPDLLLEAMALEETHAAITADIEAGKMLPSLRYGQRRGVQSVPSIFINGRYVPRWKPESTPVLDQVLDAAAKK